MQVVLEGALCGLLLSLLLGPVFIGLVKTSLMEGFTRGIVFAMGVALSDVFFILLSYWGIVRLIRDPLVENVFYVLGGLLLCAFGVYYFFRKGEQIQKTELKDEVLILSKKRSTLVKGFLMNAVNPSVLFFWIGVVGVVDAKVDKNPLSMFLFFATSVLVVFSCDVLKAFLAHKISTFVKDRWLVYLNRLLGLVLCVLGATFIWDILKKFF
jgi:L-lysine exporter family protein LysE/ArgO